MSSIATNSILLYTKPDCKYCNYAKSLFNKTGETKFLNVLDGYTVEQIREKHSDLPEDWRTYPMIWIDGTFVGGWDQVKEEVLEEPDTEYVFPRKDKLRYPDIYQLAENHEGVFWPLSEVYDYEKDTIWWKEIDEREKHLIKYILAFFAGADGIVLENLSTNFTRAFSLWEIQNLYQIQSCMEMIHAKTYSQLLYNLIQDESEINQIIFALKTHPSVRKKAEWAKKWMDDSQPLLYRLIAFVFVEGCFFSSSFASIFWLESRGRRGALTFSNLLISRDEGIHEDAGCLIASKFRRKMKESEIHKMAREAVEIESEFARDLIPENLVGMNSNLMEQHIRFIGNRILKGLGYSPIWKEKATPFSFMEKISLRMKGNFFEVKISEYAAVKDMFIATNQPF